MGVKCAINRKGQGARCGSCWVTCELLLCYASVRVRVQGVCKCVLYAYLVILLCRAQSSPSAKVGVACVGPLNAK